MRPLLLAVATVALVALAACVRSQKDRATPTASTPSSPAVAAPSASAAPPPGASAAASASASAPAPIASAEPPRGIGPYEAPYIGKRKVYFAVPPNKTPGARLIGSLHGVCNPPGYTCGYWLAEGTSYGIMVCPEGNARCGGVYDPPTWTVGSTQMDADLEKAIAVVEELHPGEIRREGAVLTGFSRGAYAAVDIVKRHPGRWPYLILNEADVSLEAKDLRAAGVKAVALIAGEYGSQAAGEQKTAKKLAAQGFRARFWVMPKAGHFYSADIGDIMRQAMDFVLAEELADGGVSPDGGS